MEFSELFIENENKIIGYNELSENSKIYEKEYIKAMKMEISEIEKVHDIQNDLECCSVKLEQKNRHSLQQLKRNNKFVSMLTIDLLKKNRMELTEKIDKNNVILIFPSYRYTENTFDLLILKTSFTDINTIPFVSGYIFNSCFSSNELDFFKYYNDKFEAYVKNNDEFKNYKFVSHRPNMIPVKFQKDYFLGNISKKLYNYNISKKYKLFDEIDLHFNIQQEFKKIFYCKKQIRLLVTPVSWIDNVGKIYGTELYIYIIEVKYPNATIKSILDTNEREMELEITNISI
ncbi:hypothetical protein Indivirus_1_170 [Indivirus ILV1]|uniref:Uncharacterized protein n=1 Tax=Indivirus ILV1 TaxID=1977633 RepID=A0A1V0SCV4_9VIRU|nr:hypothetical protein Indivirus_1_170 [Indivirus ILV1]